MNLFYGVLYAIIGQILTFLQLQGNIRYGWFKNYPVIVLLASIPISFCFLKSVQYLVAAYNGAIWYSRFWGFAIGIIVFTIMSKLMFNEPFTTKTFVSVLLCTIIVLIQIFWK